MSDLFGPTKPIDFPRNWDSILLSNKDWESKECRSCGKTTPKKYIPRLDTTNAGECRCRVCNLHLGWLRKPENAKSRPADSIALAKKYNFQRCWICLRHKDDLPAGQVLHGHHIIDHRLEGSNGLENIAGACSFCHDFITSVRRNIGPKELCE